MLQGRILKGVGGNYHVATLNGVEVCKPRGIFRKDGITPLVGDFVEIDAGVIQAILPRKSELARPKVANVDQVLVVCAILPAVNLPVLDAFLVLCEEQGVDAVVCLNKIDIGDQDEIEEILKPYQMAGYKTLAISAQTGAGIDTLHQVFQGKTTILAGASGVGKSSILNALSPSLALEVGDLSQKIARGKHTTRHTSLIEIAKNSYVVDSPGFTSLTIDHIPKMELQHYFREFENHKHNCQFRGCIHVEQQGCDIIANVGKSIHPKRYERYAKMIQMLKEN